jgi:hypothetical protein
MKKIFLLAVLLSFSLGIQSQSVDVYLESTGLNDWVNSSSWKLSDGSDVAFTDVFAEMSGNSNINWNFHPFATPGSGFEIRITQDVTIVGAVVIAPNTTFDIVNTTAGEMVDIAFDGVITGGENLLVDLNFNTSSLKDFNISFKESTTIPEIKRTDPNFNLHMTLEGDQKTYTFSNSTVIDMLNVDASSGSLTITKNVGVDLDVSDLSVSGGLILNASSASAADKLIFPTIFLNTSKTSAPTVNIIGDPLNSNNVLGKLPIEPIASETLQYGVLNLDAEGDIQFETPLNPSTVDITLLSKTAGLSSKLILPNTTGINITDIVVGETGSGQALNLDVYMLANDDYLYAIYTQENDAINYDGSTYLVTREVKFPSFMDIANISSGKWFYYLGGVGFYDFYMLNSKTPNSAFWSSFWSYDNVSGEADYEGSNGNWLVDKNTNPGDLSRGIELFVGLFSQPYVSDNQNIPNIYSGTPLNLVDFQSQELFNHSFTSQAEDTREVYDRSNLTANWMLIANPYQSYYDMSYSNNDFNNMLSDIGDNVNYILVSDGIMWKTLNFKNDDNVNILAPHQAFWVKFKNNYTPSNGATFNFKSSNVIKDFTNVPTQKVIRTISNSTDDYIVLKLSENDGDLLSDYLEIYLNQSYNADFDDDEDLVKHDNWSGTGFINPPNLMSLKAGNYMMVDKTSDTTIDVSVEDEDVSQNFTLSLSDNNLINFDKVILYDKKLDTSVDLVLNSYTFINDVSFQDRFSLTFESSSLSNGNSIKDELLNVFIVDDNLFINSKADNNGFECFIFNMEGKKCLSFKSDGNFNQYKKDVSMLNDGIYLIQFNYKNGLSLNKKLIKN